MMKSWVEFEVGFYFIFRKIQSTFIFSLILDSYALSEFGLKTSSWEAKFELEDIRMRTILSNHSS